MQGSQRLLRLRSHVPVWGRSVDEGGVHQSPTIMEKLRLDNAPLMVLAPVRCFCTSQWDIKTEVCNIGVSYERRAWPATGTDGRICITCHG